MSEQVSWLCAVMKNSSRTSRRAQVEMRASRSKKCEKRQMRVRFCWKSVLIQVHVVQMQPILTMTIP